MFSDVCVFSLNACYFVPAASLRFAYMSNKSVVGDLVEALLAQGNDSGFRTFLEQFLLALERFLIATKAESYDDVTWIAHFIFLLCFVSHVFFVVRHVCITFFVSDMWLEVTHWNDIRSIAEAAQETANEFN